MKISGSIEKTQFTDDKLALYTKPLGISYTTNRVHI